MGRRLLCFCRVFFVFLVMLVLGCQGVETRVQPETNRDLERYDRAAEIIYQDYVDPVSAQKLIAWSMDGIEKGFRSSAFINEENDPSLGSGNSLDYSLKSSHDIEGVKSKFSTVFTHCLRNYKGFSSRDLVDSAIQGMLAHLDPQCALLSPNDLQKIKTGTRGKFTGIGIVVTMKDGYVTAVFSIEGTPAQSAGIVAGDRIHRINGVKIDNVEDAVRETRGSRGEKVTLTISRQHMETPADYEVVREVIPNKSVYTRALGEGFGYAWIGSFDENTARDFERALAAMEAEKGALRGLVLDLRDNPGGLLAQAIEVSDLFLEKGRIVSVKGRIERNSRDFEARSNSVQRSYPIVVLINEKSASAAEIVASALKENSRAIVLGKPSYGKGSIQAVEDIGGGYGIKITIARYHAPKGNLIEGQGVAPDILIGDMLAGRLGKGISGVFSVTDDPVIGMALLAMEGANSPYYDDLLSAARGIVNAQKEGAGVDDGFIKGENDWRKRVI